MKKNKSNQNIKNRLKSLMVGFLCFVFLVFSSPSPVLAALATDEGGLLNTIFKEARDAGRWFKDEVKSLKELSIKSATYEFLLRTLDNFAQKMAQDVAMGVATGDKGRNPLQYTKDWKKDLRDSGDAAAGTFIEKLGKKWDFNLCEPDLSLKLNFAVGLFKIRQPEKPKCTFSSMKKNWEQSVRDPNFLKNFAVSFRPEESDIGLYLKLKEDSDFAEATAKDIKKLERQVEESSGAKAVHDLVSNNVLTPATKIANLETIVEGERLLAEIRKKEALLSGDVGPAMAGIMKDMFVTFGKTFANTLIRTYLNGTYTAQDAEDFGKEFCKKNPLLCGRSGGSDGSNGSSLTNPSAQGGTRSNLVEGYQSSKFVKTKITDVGKYDVLANLTSCNRSQDKPGPNTCVIDSNFGSAISDKMTVKEAITRGLINGEMLFDPKAKSRDDYQTVFSLRSLMILRKYRIIPVGWELAMRRLELEGATKSLNSLIAEYSSDSSPYKKLVDPNWVLKLPAGYCKAQGVGPEIVSSVVTPGRDFDGDGSWSGHNDVAPTRSIVRNSEYCADEQSCIKENLDGSCKFYGYCMEEKRLWKFDGDQCDAVNNTCQTFDSPQGTTVSYLKNSLDWGTCSADNSGCQSYCNDFDANKNKISRDGTVAYWNMDELNNNIILDKTGGNSATVSGATLDLVEKRNGNALNFNAGSDVRVSDSAGLKITNGISMTAWVKTGNNGVSQYVLSKKENVSPVSDYGLLLQNSGAIMAEFTDENGVSKSLSGTLTAVDDSWHFIVATFDGSKIKIYNNGVLESTTPWTAKLRSTNSDLRFGQNFVGNMDEVVVYNRALSAEEVWGGYLSYSCLNPGIDKKIYLSGKAKNCDADQAGCGNYRVSEDGLVGYWQFDESSVVNGNSLADSSGHGREAVLSTGADANIKSTASFNASNNALQFDDADDYLEISNTDDAFNLPNAWTVTAWVNPLAIGTGTTADPIVWKIGTLGSNDDNFVLAWNIGNTFIVALESSINGTDYNVQSNPHDINNWYHVVGVYDGDNLYVYVNGVLENVNNIGSVLPYTGSAPVRIGSIAGPYSDHGGAGTFNGMIDEVSIWSRALSSGEVSGIYNNGIAFDVKNIKIANKNLECFGRTVGDATFDLPSYVSNCISLGDRFASTADGKGCFEFLSDKDKDSCEFSNGVWIEEPFNVSQYTDSTTPTCAQMGGVWVGGNCEVKCLKLDNSVCNKYAFPCKKSEVGCEKYTPTAGGSWIPGIVSKDDSCPAECSGYDTYKQESTNFETAQFPVNFIPSTAKKCSAISAGCDEFTNLASTATGGENLEYFTYMRQCEKIPSNTSGYQCGNFYTWVGSESTGYQLQSYFLKSSGSASTEDPIEVLRVEEGLGDCNDANDALTNENCKEFYNEAGEISYHLLPKTVSCSSDCTSYRKTVPSNFDLAQVCVNIDGVWDTSATPKCNINTESACDAINGVWTGTCDTDSIDNNILCSDPDYLAGVWDGASGSCTKKDYQAIKTESTPCSSSLNGCRQYTGNAGNNTRTVFADAFENKESVYNFPDAGRGWKGGSQSTESTVAGQNSLRVANGANQTIEKWLSATCSLASSAVCGNSDGCDCTETAFGNNDGDGSDEVVCKVSVNESDCSVADFSYNGGSYLLSFWAKGNTGDSIDIDINDSSNNKSFGSVVLSNQWQYYTLGPLEFDVEGWSNYKLRFLNIGSNFGGAVLSAYFDNISLEEVTDSVFVVKDSWNTPAVCDQDSDGNSQLYYMLGCDQYSDSQGKISYLKSFSNLCRQEAVGCGSYIDTHNSDVAYEKVWNDGLSSEITVPADSMIYLAKASDYGCTTPGCSVLGEPIYNQNKTIVDKINEVYKISDPQSYDTILCQEQHVGCETFTSGESSYYFKDPKEQLCEYVKPDDTDKYGWYKKAGSYKAGVGLCPISDFQNFGKDYPAGWCVGGAEDGQTCLIGLAGECAGGYCSNWVGTCPATQSSCTAFVDPLSDSSVNLIANGDFARNIPPPTPPVDEIPDSWDINSTPISFYNYVPLAPAIFTPPAYVRSIYVSGGSELYQKNISISPDTAYVLSGDIRKSDGSVSALIQATCENYSFGSSENIYLLDGIGNINGNDIQLVVENSRLDDTSFKNFSLRFFSGGCVSVKILVGGINGYHDFTNISLRGVGIYNYLDDTLDDAKNQCDNVVNSDNGCVLINNRNNADWGNVDYSGYLNYNANTSNGLAPQPCEGFSCNADTLIKVDPDRDCAKWRTCKTSSEVGSQQVCSAIGICEAMDDGGNCIRYPLDYSNELNEKINMTFDDPGKIKNLTGLSRVGFDWGSKTIDGKTKTLFVDGNLPPAQMSTLPYDLTANLLNGGFEEVESIWIDKFPGDNDGDGSNEDPKERFYQPKYWTNASSEWNNDFFGVINNPIDHQDIGIDAIEGNSILQLKAGSSILPLPGSNAGSNHAVSNTVVVSSGEDYIISGYINTLNLKNIVDTKPVYGAIVVEDATLFLDSPLKMSPVYIQLEENNDWTFVRGAFKTGTGTGQIKIRLADITDTKEPCDGCVGEVYFDSIVVKTALEIMKSPTVVDPSCLLYPNNESLSCGNFEPLSCRLYPTPEAASCEYKNDDGFEYQGLYGYCMEHDPNNPEYCLNWYPIDVIPGNFSREKTDEGAGFSSSDPIFYCLQERRAINCTYDDANDKFLPEVAGDETTYCDVVTQVVQDSGANKAWAGRVNKERLYTNPIGYTYNTSPSFFGKIDPAGDDPASGTGWNRVDYGGLVKYAPYSCNDDRVPYDLDGVAGPLEVASDCDVVDDSAKYLLTDTSTTLYPKYDPAYTSSCVSVNGGVCTASDSDYFETELSINLGTSSDWEGSRTVFFENQQKEKYAAGECVVVGCEVSSDEKSGNISSTKCIIDSTDDPAVGTISFRCDNNWHVTDFVPGLGFTHMEWHDNCGLTMKAVCTKTNTSNAGANAVVDVVGNVCPVSIPNNDLSSAREVLNRTFAQGYDSWNYDEDPLDDNPLLPTYGKYVLDNESIGGTPGTQWAPPTLDCADVVPTPPTITTRPPEADNVNCFISPQVENVKVNTSPVSVGINNGGRVTLQFNSRIDNEQLPLTSLKVDWRDGNASTESGVSMFDRRSDPPHVYSHNYIYNNLLIKDSSDTNIDCGSSCSSDINCQKLFSDNVPFCRVKPEIVIKDNWNKGNEPDDTDVPFVYVLSQ